MVFCQRVFIISLRLSFESERGVLRQFSPECKEDDKKKTIFLKFSVTGIKGNFVSLGSPVQASSFLDSCSI